MTEEKVIELIKTDKFYLCKDWKKKRKEVLRRDHYECQRCKRNHKVSKATTVHHIKHLKEHPELALDDDNLESLCGDCHNLEHPEKLKDFCKSKRWNDEKW